MQLPTRILALTIALAARPLCAQDAADPAPLKLDPIRVTADLWEQPLARIPASVTVYDAAALQAGAVRHFGDLVDQIPNLTWTDRKSHV